MSISAPYFHGVGSVFLCKSYAGTCRRSGITQHWEVASTARGCVTRAFMFLLCRVQAFCYVMLGGVGWDDNVSCLC